LHVGTDLFSEIGDLVDERDLRGQKGVCGIFDELGGTSIGVENWRLIEISGR